MNILLNEKSLDGQFADPEDFYQTLPVMSTNLKVLKELRIPLLKHSSLYNRKITKDMTIYDLQNRKGIVKPVYRDRVRQWKRELSCLTMSPPFWDDESTDSNDSLEEAAKRNTDVLSFKHPEYHDLMVFIQFGDKNVSVKSAVTTRYLLDIILERGVINTLDYLKFRYRNGKIRTEYLDRETTSAVKLQKTELKELIIALDRFESASWEEIQKDNFFYYKSYKPSSKKQDYFVTTTFSDRKIDKFRCGKHSQIRCFGYREKDEFYVIMIERDHRISDTG